MYYQIVKYCLSKIKKGKLVKPMHQFRRLQREILSEPCMRDVKLGKIMKIEEAQREQSCGQWSQFEITECGIKKPTEPCSLNMK